MTDIAVSKFVQRQTADSRLSHFDGTWDELRDLTVRNYDAGNVTPGYRDGVVLVTVPPDDFHSAVVVLQEGDKLGGVFEARQEGEAPRKAAGVLGKEKGPAVVVDIVIYRHDVLVEGNEQSCDSEWEIISINCRPSEAEMPMLPGTLMANHFEISGGTATGLSDSKFIAKLREAYLYWGDKAFVLPAE